MALSMLEQETVITYSRGDDYMTLCTANPYEIARLSKLPAYKKVKEDKADGEVVAVTFKAHKKLLTLRRFRKADQTEEE